MQSETYVEDSFRQHATRAVSLICIALGCVSIIVPLLYGVNPWTGVLFTLISVWAYRQSLQDEQYVRAAIAIVTILTLSAFAFAIIHGLYGALGFFLILLSSLVASLTLSQRSGIILFVTQIVILVPLAIFQFTKRDAYQNTPLLPDVLMALLIAAALYAIIRMFSHHVTVLRGREHAHLRQLNVYDTQMEEVLKTRLQELEQQITERTKTMRQLAQRGKELSHLTHDVSNTLTSLRLVLDQNMQAFSDKDREHLEQSFDYLRGILQDNTRVKKKGSVSSSVPEVVQNALRLYERTLKRHRITVSNECKDQIVSVQPGHLQRMVGNLIQNSADALQSKKKGSREIRLYGRKEKMQYLLTIEDNGSGIPEHLLPLVREPWFSTKGEHHMGMGLSSVTELLALYNGAAMSIDSKQGTHTKVTLHLPI